MRVDQCHRKLHSVEAHHRRVTIRGVWEGRKTVVSKSKKRNFCLSLDENRVAGQTDIADCFIRSLAGLTPTAYAARLAK